MAFGPTAGSPVSAMTYGYEDDNDLVRLEHRFNSGALVKVIRHAYDKSGKLKSSATNDSAWAPLAPVATPDNRTYSANVLDQYTSLTVGGSAATSIAYDSNGNLTSDGTWTFAYDAENHLTSANKAGAAVTYTYDALGRRQTKTVNGTLTNYLSAGDEEIAEYDASGNMLRRYIPGPGTDQPVVMVTVSGSTNTIRFFHADRQGSVVAMADTTGALVEGPYTYDPYGNSASSTAGVPFRYAGRRLDAETGLYYYRARYYSASLGRFLQTDPVGYDDQMNLYGFVHNDPFNFVDSSGSNAQGAHKWATRNVGYLGYSPFATEPRVKGWFRGNITRGVFAPKCNFFVNDALAAGGDPVGRVNGEDRIPSAADWGNPDSQIEGYRPLGPGETPIPGDVVGDGHHVGIFAPLPDGSPGTISAPTNTPDMPQFRENPIDAVVHNDWGFRKDQPNPITIWRCTCDDPKSKDPSPGPTAGDPGRDWQGRSRGADDQVPMSK